MKFQCLRPKCPGELERPPYGYDLMCTRCGEIFDYGKAVEWNHQVRLVWVRSSQVSYSTEILNRDLLPDGRLRTPGMEAFRWERWG